MKKAKNTLKFVLIACLSIGFVYTPSLSNEVYAFEYTPDTDTYKTQRGHLQEAVNDEINVVNSNMYFNYATQESKNKYESAIANGRYILTLGDEATYDQLYQAMLDIKNAKESIVNDAKKVSQKYKLEVAVEENRKQANAARYILENLPNTVRGKEDKIREILQRSELLLQRAEEVLANM